MVTSSCVRWLLPPLPHPDPELALSLPLQHPKLPSRQNLPCSPALKIIFSALRSQLKCHLFKEDFAIPLTKAGHSILLTLG